MRVKWAAIKESLFSNRSIRQTVIKNTFWLTAGNIVGRLIKAALIIYVARALGAAGYGVFSYAVSLAAFFSLFSDIGVNGILTREGARNPEALPEYLGTSLGIKIVLLAITNAIVFTVMPSFAGNVAEALPLLPLVALLITADGLRDLTFSVTRAKERMQTEAGVSIATNLAITLLGIAAMFFFQRTPFGLMVGYTLGSVCGTVIAYWLLREHFKKPWKYFRLKLVGPILLEALPFGLMGILGTLMLNTDTLIVAWLTPAAEAARTLGIYAAAQRPVQVLYIIPSILSTAFFPALARLAIEDRARFRALLERAVAFAFLIGLPLTLGGLAVARNLMLILFGPEYVSGTATFMVLLFTILVVFPGNFVSNAVFAHDSEKSFFWYLGLGVSANIVLDLILIPPFGIFGSAIATLTAQILANAVTWRKLKSIQSFNTLRHLPRMLAAGVAMAALALILNATTVPVLITITLAAGGYLFFLYLFKEPLLKHVSG